MNDERDMAGLIAARQRELVLAALETQAIEEASAVLMEYGAAAATQVLVRYANRIARLGGHLEWMPLQDPEPVLTAGSDDPSALPRVEYRYPTEGQ